MASKTRRRSVGGRPRFFGAGSIGRINAHWVSVSEELQEAIFIARGGSAENESNLQDV